MQEEILPVQPAAGVDGVAHQPDETVPLHPADSAAPAAPTPGQCPDIRSADETPTPHEAVDRADAVVEAAGADAVVDAAGAAAAAGAAPPVVPEQPRRLSDDEVLERSKQLWREREPLETSDPVAHSAICCLRQPSAAPYHGEARVVAARRRGRSHAQDGKYCEDAFAVAIAGEWSLVAVADGAGSATLARVGSRIAAECALEHLRLALGKTQPADDVAELLRDALVGAMADALAGIKAEAARRDMADIDALASTLLLAAYRANGRDPWIGAAQVGDGGIAARMANGTCSVFGVADRGRSSGETMFLTSESVPLAWGRRVVGIRLTEPLDALLVGTDGVFDDYTPPFGNPLSSLFEDLAPIRREEAPEQWLLGWLDYWRRGSFDDRTLVAVLPGASVVGEAP